VTTMTDDTSAATGDIVSMREQIDQLDAAIAKLVADRRQLSKQIQAARIRAGGTRLQLGRERVVLDGYRQALGADGPLLGEVVLRICRGTR
jgi:chorismate mutase